MQLWLIAAVVNIKRVVKQMVRRGPTAEKQELTGRIALTVMFASVANENVGILRRILLYLTRYFCNGPH